MSGRSCRQTEIVGRPSRAWRTALLLTGQGRFAADISFPGQLHMRVVRSPVAHGRLLGIDASKALRSAGRRSRSGPADDIATIPPIDFA